MLRILTEKGSLGHWLGTELTEMVENVFFFIVRNNSGGASSENGKGFLVAVFY